MRLAPQETRTYFLTFVTASRRRLFQVEENARLMLDLLQTHRTQERFALYAFVVMPDHVHLLLTPAEHVSLEKAVQFVKGGFSFQLKSKLNVWQSGYNASQVNTTEKFEDCMRYIETNPVRAGLVSRPESFPYSSRQTGVLIDARPLWFEAPRLEAFTIPALKG